MTTKYKIGGGLGCFIGLVYLFILLVVVTFWVGVIVALWKYILN